MNNQSVFKRMIRILVLLCFVVLFSLASSTGSSAATILQRATSSQPGEKTAEPEQPASPQVTPRSYIPLINMKNPWRAYYGVEADVLLTPNSTLLTKALALHIDQNRINRAISWKTIQPVEGGPFDWSSLVDFEATLIALNQAGIQTAVIVDDYPYWATQIVREDGQPTSCAPLKADKLDDFAYFVRTLVARYKTPEYNVKTWELGNEPDLGPNEVPVDNPFGCWGVAADFYYGGEWYGEMIKTVGQQIRLEDPSATIWLGGLLLSGPTYTPTSGGPGAFLRGILEAGAGPYFDGVPYHYYPPYVNARYDHDNGIGGQWVSWGGGTVGKARYIRQILASYGYSKPVFLNETGLMCPPDIAGTPTTYCDPPQSDFYEMQGNYLIRAFVRGTSENISGFSWYTLDGPGWRNVGLLDARKNPRPAYFVYQQLNLQLEGAYYLRPVNYGNGIEAYAFRKGAQQVHVIWAYADQSLPFEIPQDKFVSAADRYGYPITPGVNGSNYVLQAVFDPIYVVRLP